MKSGAKCRNWFEALRGHSRSSAMSLFDRSRTTSYWTLLENVRLSCTVFKIASYLSKVADFNPPYLLNFYNGLMLKFTSESSLTVRDRPLNVFQGRIANRGSAHYVQT